MSNSSVIPTPATPDVCTIAILVDGNDISGQLHLLSVAVEKELNRIPKAVLHFQDGEASQANFALSSADSFIPGKEIDIQLGYRSQNTSVFKGIVIKHSIKVRKNGSVLIVECRDKAVRMTGVQKNRYHTDKKDSDIIEELIGTYGLQHNVTATQPDLKEVVQYNATDWDFILCRAEANGQLVVVEDGALTIAAPNLSANPTLTLGFGSTLLELDAEIDARWQSDGLKASSWNATDQELLEADAQEPTTPSSGNLTPANLATVIDDGPLQLRHAGKLSQPELQTWADAHLLRHRLARIRGRARCQGFSGIKPGQIIELSGVGARFLGKVYVSGVRHLFAEGNWETDVQLGLDPEPFVETFNLRPLPASGLIPALSTLQIGVVTVLENDPDGEDRIKVRLPLVSVSEEGIWARLATLDAGANRGTYFRPEIGDEVIVGFLGDDPRYPVVLGACHSSAKPAPVPAKDDNHLKGYVSREQMKFSFDDEKKIITIETPGGNILKISDEDKGIALTDQNGNKITLNDTGIVIESTKDLTLKAAKDIKMEGMNIEVNAQTGFKAKGTSSAEMSSASTTIKGSATTVIQGGLVQIN